MPVWHRENSEYYLPFHQTGFKILVQRPGLLKKREELGLNSLSPEVTRNGHPTASFGSIIKAAILGSPESKLSVKELCAVIPRRYTYYANLGKSEAVLRSFMRQSKLFEAQLPDAYGRIDLWSVVGHADCIIQTGSRIYSGGWSKDLHP
ncbi:hypothetical protein JB92DRAFT_1264752 [Gautieria morchelliformis]|nr:hypothetical protein JB92DRAFT_1264752 [Gautieria morchelliformis]